MRWWSCWRGNVVCWRMPPWDGNTVAHCARKCSQQGSCLPLLWPPLKSISLSALFANSLKINSMFSVHCLTTYWHCVWMNNKMNNIQFMLWFSVWILHVLSMHKWVSLRGLPPTTKEKRKLQYSPVSIQLVPSPHWTDENLVLQRCVLAEALQRPALRLRKLWIKCSPKNTACIRYVKYLFFFSYIFLRKRFFYIYILSCPYCMITTRVSCVWCSDFPEEKSAQR